MSKHRPCFWLVRNVLPRVLVPNIHRLGAWLLSQLFFASLVVQVFLRFSIFIIQLSSVHLLKFIFQPGNVLIHSNLDLTHIFGGINLPGLSFLALIDMIRSQILRRPIWPTLELVQPITLQSLVEIFKIVFRVIPIHIS